jgi:hypothetical protein
MQRVETHRNSKVQELSDKLAVGNPCHTLLLLRGSQIHCFRELEVRLHGRHKGVTVSHVKVPEYKLDIEQADSVSSSSLTPRMDWRDPGHGARSA